jgi:bifunctional DNA-binding transcriptional regulator/antitoxin component of YhaV-PrlF toxin-antitoxin module
MMNAMKGGATAILTTDFLLTIPESVRQRHGWAPGQVFELVPEDIGVRLEPIAADDPRALAMAEDSPSGDATNREAS